MKAIVYTRQSITTEADSASIAVQNEACKRWCDEHGIEIIGQFSDADSPCETYPDTVEGHACADADLGWKQWVKQQKTTRRALFRQGLGQALDLIDTARPEYLVVSDSTRLGRSATNSNLGNFLTAYLMERRCSVVDVSSNNIADYSNATMQIFTQMKDALEYHSLAVKRKNAMASVARRINSYRKYSNAVGVVWDGETVQFDERIRPVIQYIYEAMAGGSSYGTILDRLNTEWRGLAKGKQWYLSNIRSILKNLTYCGYMCNTKHEIDRATNIPSPVVSYALWCKANEMAMAKKTNAGKNMAKGNHRFLPLSGYLRCECGRRLTFFLDRNGKIGYHCVNGKQHTTAIYIDDDVLATIQQIFVIHCIDSRIALASLKSATAKVDELKASIERKNVALKAKLRLVQDDSDLDWAKPEIDALKAEISGLKKELVEAQAIGTEEQALFREQLEMDFHRIMERELMEKSDYMRLLQETISHITVTADALIVHTRRGLDIRIPRIEGAHHSRRLMKCQLICDSTGEHVEDIFHYQLNFYDGEKGLPIDWKGGTVQHEDEEITVITY